MNLLLAVNVLVFLLLGIIWTRSSLLNFCIKTIFFALFVLNLIVVLHVSGYIIKAP